MKRVEARFKWLTAGTGNDHVGLKRKKKVFVFFNIHYTFCFDFLYKKGDCIIHHHALTFTAKGSNMKKGLVPYNVLQQ